LTDTDLEEICRRRRDRNRLGLRQWIVVFLTVCAGDQAGVAAHAWIIPVVGALIRFLGVPAGLIGNELSIRYGLRTIATLVFLLSALAGGLLGFTAMLPYITVLGLSVIAGFIPRRAPSSAGSAGRECTSLSCRAIFRISLRAPRSRHSPAQGGDDRVVFLHRLWRRIPRRAPVRRHARSVRRDIAAGRVDRQLRHLRTRLPSRRGRDDVPAPRRLETIAISCLLAA
jgi:hypothetical protein